MSYYDQQGWQAPVRQASWEQPPPPSRSGASSTSQRDDTNAFTTQYDEIDRAIDNLIKNGKFYPAGPRRDSTPSAHGAHGAHGPRVHAGRQSMGSNFYAAQRFQNRPNDADQMMQAKRRMAAQRERDLRNYHQEQQYNRSLLAEMSSNKSERSMSPSTLSEEGRRELIARQHRALYGAEAAGFGPQSPYSPESAGHDQTGNGIGSGSAGMRGTSPRGVDAFGMPKQGGGGENGQNDNKTTSPNAHQSGKIPTPPSDDSNHARSISKSTTVPVGGSMGPIGSRPNAQHAPGQNLAKRTTSPLPPSLGYAFGATEQNNERTNSSNSNVNNQQKEASGTPSVGAWGTGSGVWGSNKIGTSVWG